MITALQAKRISESNLKMIRTGTIFFKIEERAKEGLNKIAIEGFITDIQKQELIELGYTVQFTHDSIIISW